MTPDDLQPGAMLYACSDEGIVVPLKLASLFKVEGDEQLYALAGSSDRLLKSCKRIAVAPAGGTHDAIGTLADQNPLTNKGGPLRDLFNIVAVDDKIANRLTLAEAQTSKIKEKDIFSKHAVRLRKIVEPSLSTFRGKNRQHRRRYLRGYVSGQTTHEKIFVGPAKAGKRVTLDRAMIAKSCSNHGRRKFIDQGDAGTPVISGSKRLVGFVVGCSGDETLVLPAEDLAHAYRLTFYSPDTPTQAPRVRTKPLKRAGL